jgi:hypothetical protein
VCASFPAKLPVSELTLYLQWKVDSRAHERVSSMGLRLLDVIARHTLGWHKRAAPLSLSVMAAGSGLYRQRVPALLRELEGAGLVAVERASGAARRANRPSTITIAVPIERHVKYRGSITDRAASLGAGSNPGPAGRSDSTAELLLAPLPAHETGTEGAGIGGVPVSDYPGPRPGPPWSPDRTTLVPGADYPGPRCGLPWSAVRTTLVR